MKFRKYKTGFLAIAGHTDQRGRVHVAGYGETRLKALETLLDTIKILRTKCA